ncbi:MAG: hypothetical protein M3081_00435 [Gemmatimonadota bacterium]|nr:hypothetical protein [Gemmatimonadota bacterium]
MKPTQFAGDVLTRFRRYRAVILAVLAIVAVSGLGAWRYWRAWSTEFAPTYVAADSVLRAQPLYFYPSTTAHPRAFIFFFGNDVAFWQPHQVLAHRLSRDGYSVVGLDLRQVLAVLPSTSVEARESSFTAVIGPLIARARRELSADSLPIVLAGHSFGAEIALWLAMHQPPPKLAGVMAMSTRGSGHFFVTPGDWSGDEASGPGSFSTVALVHDIPPTIRIAVVRGKDDGFAKWDSTFARVGGRRYRRFVIPFTGHSIRHLTFAGPFIERAMTFLTESSP